MRDDVSWTLVHDMEMDPLQASLYFGVDYAVGAREEVVKSGRRT
jgi:hypothetical protein